MKTALSSAALILPFAFFALVAHAYHVVNINTATLEELDTLDGVGPATAQKIIDARPYASIEEISKVDGIGEPGSVSYEKIKDHITVSGETQIESTEEATSDSDDESTSSTNSSDSTSSASSKTTSVTARIVVPSTMVAGATQEFVGELSKNNDDTKYANFSWNFGDGTTGKGQKIDHTYAHLGSYVVVLMVEGQSFEAEARLTVEVVALDLVLVAEQGGVLAVKNNSKREVDIGGWFLAQGDASFYIPLGTVVLSGGTLRFDPSVTKIEGNSSAQLLYQSGAVAANASPPQPAVLGAKTTGGGGLPSDGEATSGDSSAGESPYPEPVGFGAEAAPSAVSASPAAAGAEEEDLPLWSYGLGLLGLLTLGVASTLYIQRTKPQPPRLVDEFKITES